MRVKDVPTLSAGCEAADSVAVCKVAVGGGVWFLDVPALLRFFLPVMCFTTALLLACSYVAFSIKWVKYVIIEHKARRDNHSSAEHEQLITSAGAV